MQIIAIVLNTPKSIRTARINFHIFDTIIIMKTFSDSSTRFGVKNFQYKDINNVKLMRTVG